MLVKGKTSHQKEYYLCGGTEFNKRPSSMRDRPELEVFECVPCWKYYKDIRWPITSTGWQMENLAAIKNGIFLIRPSYTQLTKNNLQLLENVIRSWQVFQDIENIGVIKLCAQNWAT